MRSSRRQSSTSFPLEQPIPVNYRVAGSRRWLDQAIGDVLPEDRKTLVETDEQAQEICSWACSQPRLGVDTEGGGPREEDGLDPVSPSSRLFLVQVGTPDLVWLLEPGLLDRYPCFRELLEREDILFLLQHAVHDFKFLLVKHQVHLVNMYDTMLAEQIITAGKEGVKVGLADLARKYPPYRYIRKDIRSEFANFSGRFTRSQLYYSARDIVLLFPIADGQVEIMNNLGLKRVARDEFDCIPATAEMELTGVCIDVERVQLHLKYYTRMMQETEEEILRLYNVELRAKGLSTFDMFGEVFERFDISSADQKLKALDRLGVKLEDVQYETLIVQDHPICKPMADYMGYQKMVSTYGTGLLEKLHYHTGRRHPKFHQHGMGASENGEEANKDTIATGRYSGDMQQFPRPEKKFDVVDDDWEYEMVRETWPEAFAQVDRCDLSAA